MAIHFNRNAAPEKLDMGKGGGGAIFSNIHVKFTF